MKSPTKKLSVKTKTFLSRSKLLHKNPSPSRDSNKPVRFSKRKLKEEILREAKILNRHMGSAETIADKVVSQVERWVDGRKTVTEEDIIRVASEKLKNYDKDLAYIYKNHGKII